MKTSRRTFMGMAATSLVLSGGGESGCVENKTGANQLLNLYDNIVAQAGDAISHWGFSAYIDYRGKNILFDSGACPDIFEHNARAFGVNLSAVDIAVLSHSHSDHIFGFDSLLKINRSFAFYLPNDPNLGGILTMNELPAGFEKRKASDGKQYTTGFVYRHANSRMVAKHSEIADGAHLIATSSPLVGYFSKYPPNEKEPLLLGLPELSLALVREDGRATLISGCSHSKIEEIVKAAKAYLGKDVALVIGGFHHAPYSDEYVAAIAKMLKDDLGVEKVAASHCTGEKARAIFKEIYKDDFLNAGLGSRLKL